MKKESLTIDMIKKDCLGQFKTSIIQLPIIFIVLVIFLIIFTYFLFRSKESYILFVVSVVILTLLLFVYVVLSSFVTALNEYNIIKSGKFHIVRDTLIERENKKIYMSNSFAAAHNQPYILHFATYGKFGLFVGTNYRSSEVFDLNDDGVYNYSNIGDEFYLVMYKKRILAVYNTKLFELDKDLKIVE